MMFCDGSSQSARRDDFIWTEIRRKKWIEWKITFLRIYIEKKRFLHQLFFSFFFFFFFFYQENGCKSYRFLNAHFRRRFLMLGRLFVKSRGLVINTLHYSYEFRLRHTLIYRRLTKITVHLLCTSFDKVLWNRCSSIIHISFWK